MHISQKGKRFFVVLRDRAAKFFGKFIRLHAKITGLQSRIASTLPVSERVT
jgi:hypothetical protein